MFSLVRCCSTCTMYANGVGNGQNYLECSRHQLVDSVIDPDIYCCNEWIVNKLSLKEALKQEANRIPIPKDSASYNQRKLKKIKASEKKAKKRKYNKRRRRRQ